ncbi:subtilisin-like proprotein convertase family protein [Bradyrhizobium huanghuaihaiense]|uniref:Subtilisin-like proprotein convertase family protein n=1 Tax=Bradyrhizobium huanghuaihaiense TaxID=990078 RepID=A0A562QTP3_9BRAD|nr:S8 family serine peptidase [Bradyrhizobium huanghuaihaiense]TWI60181.1 subtilisin-like proprotein convertase family protein [Bradyrhizobium huanghuaihaiense]
MAKRGVNDQYGNFSEANANALEWEFIGLNIASAHADSFAASTARSDSEVNDGSAADGGPEGFAAKKGGSGTGGGNTSTGGTGTSTSGSGTSTSGTGTTTSSGTTGQGSTTLVLHDVPTHWQTLNAPTGNSTLPTDSYFSQQWGLTNSTAGIDVAKAWQNYTGLGVKIGVIDDGFDYNHGDINPHYLLNLDYDTVTGGADAFGSSTTDKHGTTVMGVIGAAANGTGVVGVAYNAGIAGFRIGYGATGTTGQATDAFNHVLTNGMDVVNASWGYTAAYSDNFLSSAFSATKVAIQNDVSSGRGGLGIDIVFAAGNGGPTDNVNYHNFQNDPFVITVAATDTSGHITSYSSPGAAILISAPGTAKTDDRVGTDGYSTNDYINISGTSYAAPYVSGVVALMLQANPNLGFRDVQDILAYSAKNTDPTNASWHTNGAHDWNGGGLHFSESYGFGMVDATAAVRLAESWQYQSTYANMSSESASHTDNAAIPDGVGGLTSQMTFASSLDVERMVIDLNIAHASPSDLLVTLTSPSGTTATLASHPANGTGTGIVFQTTANSFWGEDAKGTWTLTVTDSVAGNSGTLNSWTLTALGDSASTPITYVYTDEFASVTNPANLILTDSSGNATLNTAAVTSGSYLDLHAGALDTIAGKTLQIAATTIIKNVWAGDGNDTIIANDFGDTIQAGRGNNTIVTGKGADVLYAAQAGSIDTFVFNALSGTTDTIRNWVSGNNSINVGQLLSSLGYSGSNPITDGWLSFISDAKGGTNIVVDAHNGAAPQSVVDIVGIAPTLLHESTTTWSLIV